MTGTTVKLISSLTGAAAAALLAAGPAAAAPATPMPTFNYGSSSHDLLLSADDLGSIMSADGMKVRGNSDKLVKSDIEPSDCAGAFQPGTQEAFTDTTPDEVQLQSVADGEPGRNSVLVIQSAVTLSSKSAAKQHLSATVANWKQCAGETITFTSSSSSDAGWKLGKPELRRDNTVMAISETSAHAACEHAVAGYGAMFIDVMACNFKGGDPEGLAEQIAVAISKNASNQTA